MADTYTTNLNLKKPGYDSYADIKDLNDNFDKIDEAIANAGSVKSVNGKTGDVVINISARNLLDNSDFTNPVNQRGITSLTTNASAYTIDRWRLDKNKTITVNNGSITIDGGWMTQFVGTPIDTTKTYTAALMLDDGTLIVETGVPADKTRKTYFGFDVSAAGVVYVGIKTAGTFKWAALYEGEYTAETLPPYIPKGYVAELAECMFYDQEFVASSGYSSLCWALATSDTEAVILLEYMSPMRTDIGASISVSGNWELYRPDDRHNADSIVIDQSSYTNVRLKAKASGLTVGAIYMIRANNSAGARISVSKDL